MRLDIRIPIGSLFTLLGIILAAYGLLGDPAVYGRSLGHNVNLVWGLVLLVFGVVILWIAARSARHRAPAVEGRS